MSSKSISIEDKNKNSKGKTKSYIRVDLVIKLGIISFVLSTIIPFYKLISRM